MPFDRLVGQEEAVRVLRGCLSSSRIGHAYLFYGPAGTGKSLAANLFAQAINCDAGGPDACGRCLSCVRTEHGSHPDLHILAPGTEKGENVGIQQMRDLRSDVHLRPSLGRRKVYIVPEAERLSPPATHTVLKTLEEPPPYVTIILIAPDPADLLPTVVSRCQLVRFTPEPVDVVTDALVARGVPRETAMLAAAYAEGRVGAAIRLAADTAELARRAKVLDLLQGLANADRRSALRLAEDLQKLGATARRPKAADAPGDTTAEPDLADSDEDGDEEMGAVAPASKSDLQSVVDVAASWYRDLLLMKAAGPDAAVRNVDRLDALRSAAQSVDSDYLQKALDALVRTRYHLDRNANARLAMERLVLALAPEWPRT